MSAVKQLQSRSPMVLDEFLDRCRQAERSRNEETEAALILQSSWRGKSLRTELQRVMAAACTIQCCWRGYLGKQRAAEARKQRNQQIRQAYFDHHATTIQRWWRGYYSRTRIHSYSQRKAFLAAVAQQNAAIRAALAEEAAAAAQLQQEQAIAAAMTNFEQQVCTSHHLASTACMPGIFSPPAAAVTGGLPLVGGFTIEEHLRAAAKAQVQATLKLPSIHRQWQQQQQQQQQSADASHLYNYSSSSRGKGASRSHSPLANRSKPAAAAVAGGSGSGGGAAGKLTPTLRTTLRQAAAFDAIKQERNLETRIDRAQMLVTHNGQSWVSPASRLNKPFLETQTIANCDPYQEPLPANGLLHTVTYTSPPLQTCAGTVRPPSVRSELIRSPGLDDVAAAISPKAFDPHVRKQPFFDQDIVTGY